MSTPDPSTTDWVPLWSLGSGGGVPPVVNGQWIKGVGGVPVWSAIDAADVASGTFPDARLPTRIGSYTGSASVNNADNATANGWYLLPNGAANMPRGGTDFSLHVVSFSAGYGVQTAYNLYAEETWQRFHAGAGYSAWRRVELTAWIDWAPSYSYAISGGPMGATEVGGYPGAHARYRYIGSAVQFSYAKVLTMTGTPAQALVMSPPVSAKWGNEVFAGEGLNEFARCGFFDGTYWMHWIRPGATYSGTAWFKMQGTYEV